MKKITITLLAIMTLALPVSANLNNFQKTKNYENQFSDVASNEWYANSVAEAYEYGLISGNSDTTYNPTGNVTIAETIALACRLNNTYYNKSENFSSGEKWYSPYVDYAIKNNIISANQYDNYERYATRAEFVQIISASLPSNAFLAINTVNSIPDVNNGETWAHGVYMFYRAGILSGNDLYGTFNPDSNIQRSEVATIMTRIVKPSNRRSFALKIQTQTLYTADGRSQDFKLNEVEAQLAVGWYTEPMQYLYSLDGTKQLFKKSEVNAQLAVGWYEEPMQYLYSADGRKQLFKKSEVQAQLAVGWYETIAESKEANSNSTAYKENAVNTQTQNMSDAAQSYVFNKDDIILRILPGKYRGGPKILCINKTPVSIEINSVVNVNGSPYLDEKTTLGPGRSTEIAYNKYHREKYYEFDGDSYGDIVITCNGKAYRLYFDTRGIF